jgi:hypothetical protein
MKTHIHIYHISLGFSYNFRNSTNAHKNVRNRRSRDMTQVVVCLLYSEVR